MTGDKDRFPRFVAATTQPCWNGLNDRSMPRDANAGGESAIPRKEKKPYGKPTYRFERVFETMALSCGKNSPVEFQCRFNRKNS